MNGSCYTRIQEEERNKRCSQAKLTEIDKQQRVRTRWNSGETDQLWKGEVCTSAEISPIQRNPWMHFVFHTCIIFVPVLPNTVVKGQVKTMIGKFVKDTKVTRANFTPGDYPSLDLFCKLWEKKQNLFLKCRMVCQICCLQ